MPSVRNTLVEQLDAVPASAPTASTAKAETNADPKVAPLGATAEAERETIKTWRVLVDRVRAVSPPVAAMLDLAVPIAVDPERVVVGIEDDSFENVRAEQTDARAVLTAEARAHFGTSTEVVFKRTDRGSKVASIAYLDAAKKKQAMIEARAAVERHELVQHAIRVFGAELKDVKLPAQEE
jgi:hypothetical protein